MDDRRGSYHSHRERLELNELWPSLIPGRWLMGVVHPQCTVRSPTRTSRPYLHFTVVLPYIKGVSEQIRRVFKQYDVLAYFNPVNTLRQLLLRLKDDILNERVVGPVYHIPCAVPLMPHILVKWNDC